MSPRIRLRAVSSSSNQRLIAKHKGSAIQASAGGGVGSSNQRFESPLPHHNRTSRNLSTGIIEYGFWMLKEGYSETTIERYVRLLKELAKYRDLRDPESIKIGLTQTHWADGTKEMACGAYAIYAKQHGFTFVPPRYRRVEKLPFIPLDTEVEQLIGAMGLRLSSDFICTSEKTLPCAEPRCN